MTPSDPAPSPLAPPAHRPYVSDRGRPLRMAMYGIGHSHAAGKARTLAAHPGVEFCGAFEPDPQLSAPARDDPAFAGVPWLPSSEAILGDPSIVAVCVEGAEGKCSGLARQCVEAGKHIWYDKPGGDWPTFQAIIATARAANLHVQMGYMLRYGAAFRQIADWTRDGLLGDLYAIRGHMSTSSSEARRGRDGYVGGIAFQLAPHIIDQALSLFAQRPHRVTSFLRNDATPAVPAHADNTLVVLEFERGMAMIDIANMEAAPAARRFEVYGTGGSAIVVEPFEPGGTIRLCLAAEPAAATAAPSAGAAALKRGEQIVTVEKTPRTQSYHHELNAFVATLLGQQAPDRSLDHELLAEETLHRAVGTI